MNKNEPRKPRILVVCQHFWPESFRVNDICDFLIEKGCQVDVLCGIPNYPGGKIFKGYSLFKNRRQVHNGVKIRRVFEIPRGSNTNLRIFINYISFPLASLFHVPRLLTKKYDKIFVFTYSPVLMGLAGIIVGKIKRTEVILYALDLWPDNLFSVLKVKNRFMRWLAKVVSDWHYRKPDKILAGSEKMKQQLIARTSADKNIIVLPQACEEIFEKQVYDKKLAARFNKGFNIVYTGNMSPAQSLETIVSAAKKLKDDGISDINWIMVGDGMSRASFEKQVKETGLAKDFYFEGQKPQEDIPRYTGIADALVGGLVKSDMLEATLPAKVTAYIAAGRPMVMYLDGEGRDLINNLARSGFAGPAENAEALAENIKKVYALSAKERDEIGKRARAYHFKHLERTVIYNKLYNFIFDQN